MKEPGKRIVSKADYVKAQTERGVSLLLAIVFWLITLGLLLVVVYFLHGAVIAMVTDGLGYLKPLIIVCGLIFACIFGIGTIITGSLAKDATKSTLEIDPGIPFTRANTADLPASDSLVRASEELIQQQQTVLLRAATNSEQTPSEQLVRPAERQE